MSSMYYTYSGKSCLYTYTLWTASMYYIIMKKELFVIYEPACMCQILYYEFVHYIQPWKYTYKTI